MGMGKRTTPLIAAASLAFAIAVFPATSPAADLIVGSGANALVDFSIGRAICRLIQKADPETTCEVAGIAGRDADEALAVLSAVRNGAIEFGIVQSDWQYYAFQGTGPVEFMDVRFENLRSLFSLHGKLFTVIARRDAGIESLDDLVGKRVNIGNPGSSQRAIMDMVMNAKGWKPADFEFLDELSSSEQLLALCHNRVQAAVAVVTHPNEQIAKALALCDARIVPIEGAEIGALVAENRFFASSEVALNVYPGSGARSGTNSEVLVPTFGVMATAVASSDLDDETAYNVVKSVFEDLGSLKRLHRALGTLLPDRMTSAGLSAPLHPGAARYYREHGMI